MVTNTYCNPWKQGHHASSTNVDCKTICLHDIFSRRDALSIWIAPRELRDGSLAAVLGHSSQSCMLSRQWWYRNLQSRTCTSLQHPPPDLSLHTHWKGRVGNDRRLLHDQHRAPRNGRRRNHALALARKISNHKWRNGHFALHRSPGVECRVEDGLQVLERTPRQRRIFRVFAFGGRDGDETDAHSPKIGMGMYAVLCLGWAVRLMCPGCVLLWVVRVCGFIVRRDRGCGCGRRGDARSMPPVEDGPWEAIS